MQAQNANPKPTAAEVEAAWAAYERAWQAAEAGDWTEELAAASAEAAGAYYKLRNAAEEVQA